MVLKSKYPQPKVCQLVAEHGMVAGYRNGDKITYTPGLISFALEFIEARDCYIHHM